MPAEALARLDIVDLVRVGSPRFEAAVAFVLDPHGHRREPLPGDREHAEWLVRAITRPETLGEAVLFLEREDMVRLYRRHDEHRWTAQTVRLLVARDPVLKPKYTSVDCPACGVLVGARCRSGADGSPLNYWHSGRDFRARRAGVYRRKWL